MKLIEEFDLKVINECRCKSNIYGFILFSKINYSVVKVMRDADFIDALHIISGPNFGDASPKNINWAGAPTSDYRKLHKIFFLTK